MTYEAEMKEFLEAKKLPTDEGTYPEELMTQITINAFDELTDRIQKLVDQLEDANNELGVCEDKLEDADNKLCRCKRQLEKADNRLEDMHNKLTEIKEIASDDK